MAAHVDFTKFVVFFIFIIRACMAGGDLKLAIKTMNTFKMFTVVINQARANFLIDFYTIRHAGY